MQTTHKKLKRKIVQKKKVITVSDIYIKVIEKLKIEIKITRKIIQQAKTIELEKKCKDSYL